MARPSLFGPRAGMTYQATELLVNGQFVMIDSAQAAVAATNHNGFVKVATAGATMGDGVVGVVATGVVNGQLGTILSPYAIGAKVNVVKRGIVHCLYDANAAPARDDLVCINANGFVGKWTPAVITPTMAADIGTTDVGAIVAARIADATATLTADHPTGAEITAYLDELFEDVMEEVATAEAALVKAYTTEYVSEYAAAFLADRNSVIGRVVGAPDARSTTVAVELIGLPSFQEQ